MLDRLKRKRFNDQISLDKPTSPSTSSSNLLTNYETVSLFCNHEERDNEEILQLQQSLKQAGAEIHLFYFFNSKQKLSEGEDMYSLSNLDWKKVPVSNHLETFLKRDTDLLIFCVNQPFAHYEYIAGVSSAKFKVGPNFDCFKNHCQLLIDIESGFSYQSYIRQLELFVSL